METDPFAIETDRFVEIRRGSSAPAISMLMPLYRQQPYVAAAIRSVLGQRDVVAEIVISDDASGDETFDIACATVRDWLANNETQHRIVMRRGSERLWRDHLPLLVDSAGCDLVCQAHGDDESHPDRARVLAAVFAAMPQVTLLTSESNRIDAAGLPLGEQAELPQKIEIVRYGYDLIIGGHPTLVGFALAWRRRALGHFRRLDRSFAAVGHDRILPMRAALCGEVQLIRAPLVTRREHDGAAHKLMFDEPETDGLFGWSLAWLSHLTGMKQDLVDARQGGLIAEELRLRLTAMIDQSSDREIRQMVEAYRIQVRAGRQIAWVDDDTLLALRRARGGDPLT